MGGPDMLPPAEAPAPEERQPQAAARRYSPILAFFAGVMLTLAIQHVVFGASQRPAAANSTTVAPARVGATGDRRARAGGALATAMAASALPRGGRPVSKGETERALRASRYDLEAARVSAHNARRSKSWTEEVNEFSMMSEHERAKSTLGHSLLHLSKTARVLPPVLTVRAPPAGGAVGARRAPPLPTSLDWRDAGVVTPVKNQGYCGSCWAFAATETIESRWAMAHGKAHLPELAVQQIVSCADVLGAAPWSWYAPLNGSGCFGGFETAAYEYVKDFGYLAQASAFPYLSGMPWRFPQGMMGSAQNGQCVGPFEPFAGPSSRDVDVAGPAAVLSPWELTSLTYGATVTGYATVERNSEAATMAALASEGPLAIVVDASSWHSYKSGIFDGCNQTGLELNHAVQLVGYGHDAKLKLDYWLVRNSWGQAWGEAGYIRLLRGADAEITPCQDLRPWISDEDGGACADISGTCGLLTRPSFPIVGPLEMPHWDPKNAFRRRR